MKDKANLTRRQLIKRSAQSSAILASLSLGSLKALAQTPEQTEGPFHPINRDNDLTRLTPESPLAKGEIIYVRGKVTDEQGTAIGGAVIEIWQADHQGKYDHPSDPNPLKKDDNFQFWGRATTNAQGMYQFKSIKPGSYPASPTWDRPPHIHIRVLRRGFRDLTTQMYFEGEPLNSKDLILQSLAPQEQSKVVIAFKSTNTPLETGATMGTFNIELKRI